MFDKTPEFYDKIYSFKDYEDEARKLRTLIQGENPTAHTILDVACGTATHGLILSREFAVDGLDLQPEFVEVARKKLPNGNFIVADMRTFDMGKHYDVVQCLFSPNIARKCNVWAIKCTDALANSKSVASEFGAYSLCGHDGSHTNCRR